MALAVPKAVQLRSILNYFPTQSTLYVFGYGPNVFTAWSLVGRAPARTSEADVMFVVDDPLAWHEKNLSMNPSHYSFPKYAGAKAIVAIQENWAAGVYSNPGVTVNHMLIRYGVISAASLNKDLLNWKYMYVPGILQTPVLDIKSPICAQLINNLRCNHKAALHAVLLQLPPEASKYELYYGITSLSHAGDFRFYIDEDPKKLKNLIEPIVREFDKIYMPLIEKLKPLVTMDKTKTTIFQKISPELNLMHLYALPSEVQIRLTKRFGRDLAHLDVEEAISNLAKVRHIDMYVLQTISSIVTRSRRAQGFQDSLTAGVLQGLKVGANRVGQIRSTDVAATDDAIPVVSKPEKLPPTQGEPSAKVPKKNSDEKKTRA